MSRGLTLLLFAVLVVIQLAVPAAMIDKRMTTLQEGTPYKFRIGPVDPYDPFLGRYLVLNLEAADYEGWKGEDLHPGQTVYGVLETNNDGFAYFYNLSMDAPGTRDYLKLRVAWQSGKQVRLRMPFDRYYTEENAAQQAWRVRRPGRRQPVPAHIQVRVLDGYGVLEELYFEDTPFMQYMRKKGLLAAPAPATTASEAALAPKPVPVEQDSENQTEPEQTAE
ncbi:MAG: GDYXXLXY domain-containing protein [Salinisphaeraceae bacterium]|nr:GDYXXLXY domain-containing protein [Salinisphaeraceae bacterium]